MDKTQKLVARVLLFSFGAALVVVAIANVVLAAAYLIARGVMYFNYDLWSLGVAGVAFFLSFLGVLLMSSARAVTDSRSSREREHTQ